MDYKYIKYELKDRVVLITLNRPERLNAFIPDMEKEILDALDVAEADDNIRVLVFTGEGRGFCSGRDLKTDDAFLHPKPPLEHRDGGGVISLRLFELKKPVIAAINGAAVGVGMSMTLPMDIRIASKNAKFGFVYAGRGIIPEGCSGYFLPRIVGVSQTMEWMLSARVFDAEEALRGRLVSRVVEPEELLPTVMSLAREISENTSAISIAFTKQLCWRMSGAQHPMDSHEAESITLQWIGKQPDAREGVAAFNEKRAPKFTMSVSKDMPDFYPWWEERTFRNK